MRLILFLLGSCLLVGSAPAQDRLRIDVRLVNVTVTVTDANGNYVNNLRAEDFTIEEDGVPQQIVHFSQDHAVPVSVGILLDTSGSMLTRIQAATDAIERFVRNIHRDDDIFLMTFAGRPTVLQDFTNDRRLISRALRSLHQPSEKFDIFAAITAMYDSLNAGLMKMQQGRHDKRAILLLTDGQDTWSKNATLEQVIEAIGRSEVLVYSIGISPHLKVIPNGMQPTSEKDRVNMTTLEKFAETSGGRAILLEKAGPQELDKMFANVTDELRNQYSLAYYPSNSDDGQFHRIRVKTTAGHVVRSRDGYVSSGK